MPCTSRIWRHVRNTCVHLGFRAVLADREEAESPLEQATYIHELGLVCLRRREGPAPRLTTRQSGLISCAENSDFVLRVSFHPPTLSNRTGMSHVGMLSVAHPTPTTDPLLVLPTTSTTARTGLAALG